ncbi:hypothetical protein V6N13_057217 [Hibiscus sabdariffa]
MGSSGKRGQLPTSVVPNQQTHPRKGRLFGTYYTLNAIPHPSLSTTNKHLARSRLSRRAACSPSIQIRVLGDLLLRLPAYPSSSQSLSRGPTCEHPLSFGVRANTLIHLTRFVAQGALG